MPPAGAQPAARDLAKRRIDRSAMPKCIAALQHHVKKNTCQKVNFVCPGSGSPPLQISPAKRVKSAKLCTPSLGNAVNPHARKPTNSNGAHQLATRATHS